MANPLKLLAICVIILSVSAQNRSIRFFKIFDYKSNLIWVFRVFYFFFLGYGGRCRDMRCASSEQCIGFYETCNKGQVEGTDCGSYPTCVAREGDVMHSAPSPPSSMYNNFLTIK